MSFRPYQLPSGKWRIRYFDSQGRRQSETLATLAAAKAALRRREVERDDILAGLTRPRSKQTLAAASEEWIKIRPPQRAKDNRSHLAHHIVPLLGDKLLSQITDEVVQRFIRALEAKELQPASVNNVLITLRKMMNDLGWPIKVKYKVPTSAFAWIRTEEQVTRFLEACEPPWLRVVAELALYGGLRKGEIAGLRQTSVDFGAQVIHVDRSYDGPTKSKHVRHVPLAPALAETLRVWFKAHPGELAVVAPSGPIERHDTTSTKLVRKACKRAGIPAVTLHQLRHTFASHLALRLPLNIVGSMLGHVDPRTTGRYAHLDSESLARDPRTHLDFTGQILATNDTPGGVPE